ncbi:MAG TPA: hypothetical protein VFR50_00695 [Casimicrobiaceae bacterium]|jgi:hypothetical protein|nr:hypothetical protein [Casimicrobiaceae bacterium]
MDKRLAALCGATLVAGCAGAPQKVESTQACDYALMARMEAQWQPTYVQHHWVNCPQVRQSEPKS